MNTHLHSTPPTLPIARCFSISTTTSKPTSTRLWPWSSRLWTSKATPTSIFLPRLCILQSTRQKLVAGTTASTLVSCHVCCPTPEPLCTSACSAKFRIAPSALKLSILRLARLSTSILRNTCISRISPVQQSRTVLNNNHNKITVMLIIIIQTRTTVVVIITISAKTAMIPKTTQRSL